MTSLTDVMTTPFCWTDAWLKVVISHVAQYIFYDINLGFDRGIGILRF